MKKKQAWIIIILAIVFLIIYFIPISATKQVTINANFDNTYRIVTDFSSWAKWNPAIISLFEKDSSQQIIKITKKGITFSHKNDSISVKEINPLAFNAEGNIGFEMVSYNLELIPSQNTYSTTVAAYEKTSLLYKLLPFIKKQSEGEKTLQALKAFLENNNNIYGYTIKTETITTDTVYAVIEAAVAKEDVFKTLPHRFALLTDYLHKKELLQTNGLSLSYVLRSDSVFLVTGIKVNKPASPLMTVHCVNVPKGAKMLTGFFEGKFSERNKIYAAFEKYCKDHYYENVAAPIENYSSNGLPVSDSSVVKFKFYYPVR